MAPKRPGPKPGISTTKKPKISPRKPVDTHTDTASDLRGTSSSSKVPVPGSDQFIGGLTAIFDGNKSLKEENNVLKRAKQRLRNENQELKDRIQALENTNQALTNQALSRQNQDLRNQALKSKLVKLNDDIQGIVANFD